MNLYTRKRTNLKRCAFTGYRPAKMPFGFEEEDPRCIEFKARLRDTIEALIGEGYAHFISGGALGMDMFAAEAVLELQEKYPWIILEMVSPFDAQAARWDDETGCGMIGFLRQRTSSPQPDTSTLRPACSAEIDTWLLMPICCWLPMTGSRAEQQ